MAVKSEFLNRAPIRKNRILLATLLKHCKVLVEENLGAPRTLDPPNLENFWGQHWIYKLLCTDPGGDTVTQ